jgi:hypothetical protein
MFEGAGGKDMEFEEDAEGFGDVDIVGLPSVAIVWGFAVIVELCLHEGACFVDIIMLDIISVWAALNAGASMSLLWNWFANYF